MPFTDDDRAVISWLRLNKKYSAKRLLLEFPDKGWTLGGLSKILRKIDTTGSTQRRPGSGRRRTKRTLENIERVKLSLLERTSRKEEGGTKDDEEGGDMHRRNSGGGPIGVPSQRQIARKLGISSASVGSIVRRDLGLRCIKLRPPILMSESQRKARLKCAKQLLSACSASTVSFVWFTDRRLFTVATPSHTQHERIYAAAASRQKKIGHSKSHDKGLLVYVGISALGRTGIHFLQPGVKINGTYYRDVLLSQYLLPDIRQMGVPYIFQHDGAPIHRESETLQLLRAEAVDVVQTPANSGDLNPVNYHVWNVLQESVYRTPVRDVADLRHRLCRAWHQLDQDLINAGIEQWRVRLATCVAMRGKPVNNKLSGSRLTLPPNDDGSSPACVNNESGTTKQHTSLNMDLISPDVTGIGRAQHSCRVPPSMAIISPTVMTAMPNCLGDGIPSIGPDNPCNLVTGVLAMEAPSWLESVTGTLPSTNSFIETSSMGMPTAAALSGGNGSNADQETRCHPLSGGELVGGMTMLQSRPRHSLHPSYQAHHVDELSYPMSQPSFNLHFPTESNGWLPHDSSTPSLEHGINKISS